MPWHRFALAAVLCLCAASVAAREWTDSTGKKFEATLVAIKDQQAYLEKADGTLLKMPLEKLSAADMDHLLTLPEYKDYFAKNPPAKGAPSKTDTAKTDTAKTDSAKTDSAKTPAAKASAPKPNHVPLVKIKVDDESKVGEIRRFTDLSRSVKALAFSPNAQFLAVGTLDQSLIVFDVNSSTRVSLHERLDGMGQVTCLAFTPDGKKLLSGGYRGRIEIWNVDEKGGLTAAGRFVGHNKEIQSISVTRDGKFALSGSSEKKARYWDLETGREQFAIDGFDGPVKATFLTASGKQGLAADSKSMTLIDIASGKPVQRMELTRMPLQQTVSIAPDGSKVAVSDLYTIRLWDIRSGKEYPKLEEGEIQWSSTFSPDGKYLISGGQGKINVWEVATQKKLYEFDVAQKYYVQSVAYSPDKRHITGSPGGGDLQVFRLPADLEK